MKQVHDDAAEVPRSLSFAITFSCFCASFSYLRYRPLYDISAVVNMKFSDLIFLEEGVFQLEDGHGQWQPEQCEAVVIDFAGSETELAAKRFEDDEEIL